MILELCKGVHCVDLGESFQTQFFLQNFVSIQPRTSPLKSDEMFVNVIGRAHTEEQVNSMPEEERTPR